MSFKVNINVCRVCMKSENGISLFKDRTLHEKFVYITNLKVKEEDCMPSILCNKCIRRLKVAHGFCRQAKSSEKHLRSFISKVSDDFHQVARTVPNDEEELTYLDEETDVQEFIESFDCGQYPEDEQQPPALKEEPVFVTQELEIIEIPDVTAPKQEIGEQEIYMEEFQEIIQENPDPHLYLEDGSTDGINLYDDGSGVFCYEECSGGDVEISIANQQDLLEGVESNDCKDYKIEVGDPKNKKRSRTLRSIMKLEGKSNICIKCNKDFSTKTNLMRHMSTHNGVKPYQCSVCGKGFTQNGSLKQHMFIHTGERPHVCQVCQRGFTQSKSLIFHMRRHTGEKPFQCKDCGICFRQKDGLKHHAQKYHTPEPLKDERHQCFVCGKQLSTKYSLNLHMKKHSKKSAETNMELDSENPSGPETDPEVETGVYGDSESSPPNTNGNIEKDEKPNRLVVLPILDDVIEVPCAKILHQTTPNAGTGLRMKQYQCGKCFKSYHIKRNLLHHLKNHNVSALELHECSDCEIAFDTKRSLKLHRQREHKDVIPDLNSCEYCDAPFITVTDLIEHVANIHDAIDEDCPQCNQRFTSQKLYLDHMLEHEHFLEE